MLLSLVTWSGKSELYFEMHVVTWEGIVMWQATVIIKALNLWLQKKFIYETFLRKTDCHVRIVQVQHTRFSEMNSSWRRKSYQQRCPLLVCINRCGMLRTHELHLVFRRFEIVVDNRRLRWKITVSNEIKHFYPIKVYMYEKKRF